MRCLSPRTLVTFVQRGARGVLWTCGIGTENGGNLAEQRRQSETFGTSAAALLQMIYEKMSVAKVGVCSLMVPELASRIRGVVIEICKEQLTKPYSQTGDCRAFRPQCHEERSVKKQPANCSVLNITALSAA
jgi:hypothetical protein